MVGYSEVLKLELQVDPAPVYYQGDVSVFFEKVLGKDNIADVDGIIGMQLELLANDLGKLFRSPVAYRGGK